MFAREPEGSPNVSWTVARERYDYAVQALKELSYAKRREGDTEDTIRVYVLRLPEARVIKSVPRRRARTRGLQELKKELKG